MKKTGSILLAVRMLGYQGGKILGNKWLPLVDEVRRCLARSGVELGESCDELLLFSFTHPFPALTALLESLRKGKEEHGWKTNHGPLPAQIILHLTEEDDAFPQIRQAAATEWEMLQQESIHLTRTLMRRWQELMDGRELPEHTFTDEGDGLFHLLFAGNATVRRVELFPYRSLPVRGKEKECFYCGMTSHTPAACPSKLIGMKIRGLDLVGALPFAELGAIYKAIFPDYSVCLQKIGSGLQPGQLRQDKELLVFVAYLDINRIYQLRFLHQLAFSSSSRWNDLDKTDKITVDSRNLHMGIDCLRVGQYEKAEEILLKESKRRDGKQFHALVALAFRALDLGRDKDMAHYLERAKNTASQEKDRLAIQLLLSRFYELQNDSWKAKEAISGAEKVLFDALECQYRKLQYAVQHGFDEIDIKRLRSLMTGQKEMFMAALLDPHLLPVHGLINDLAVEHLQLQQREAEKKLRLAEAECDELRHWLDEGDPLVSEHEQSLAQLRNKFAGQGYYDLLDVLERCAGIIAACQRIRKTKSAELEKRKTDCDARHQQHLNFWQAYPYKNAFTTFLGILSETSTALVEAQQRIEAKEGRAFRAAVSLLDKAGQSYATLEQMQEKMIRYRLLLNGLKIFTKHVIISEIALLFACFSLFLGLPAMLSGTESGLERMMADPLLRKKSLLLAAFFLAPFLAIVWTLWAMRNEQ